MSETADVDDPASSGRASVEAMRTVSKLTALAFAIAVGFSLVACTAMSEEDPTSASSPASSATPTPPASDVPVTDTGATDPAYEAAVAAYPRGLPDGYEFPSGLIGADAADKWWWCSQIDAAWEAYFTRQDEATAVDHLHTAAEIDPGSYGRFDQPADSLPRNRKIDRDVRYIDGGVDSQYVEYTAQGCWDWAKSVGAGFPPLP